MGYFSVLFVFESFVATESAIFLKVRVSDFVDKIFTGEIKVSWDVGLDMSEKVKDTFLKGPAFGAVVGFDLEFFDDIFDIVFGQERYLPDVIVILSDTVFAACSLFALTMFKHTELDDSLSMLTLVHFVKNFGLSKLSKRLPLYKFNFNLIRTR